MPVKITTESAADLSSEIADEFGIDVIPMNIIIDGKSYKDGVTINTHSLSKIKSVAKTSAVNPEEYKAFFSKYREIGFDVIHISLSSKISATYQNAVSASENFDNVYVVDSLNLSGGIGLLCVMAAQLASAGEPVHEILKLITQKRDVIRTSFVLEDTDTLRRGGRCTAIEALGANFLGIKPSIEIKDGKLVTAKKFHGKGASARIKYIEKRIQSDNPDRSVCFLNHTLGKSDEVGQLYGLLKEKYGFERIFVNEAGCCISAHCGRGCMGVIYIV